MNNSITPRVNKNVKKVQLCFYSKIFELKLEKESFEPFWRFSI